MKDNIILELKHDLRKENEKKQLKQKAKNFVKIIL